MSSAPTIPIFTDAFGSWWPAGGLLLRLSGTGQVGPAVARPDVW